MSVSKEEPDSGSGSPESFCSSSHGAGRKYSRNSIRLPLDASALLYEEPNFWDPNLFQDDDGRMFVLPEELKWQL